MFDENICDEQINSALKKVGMYERIQALPDKLDYVCKDDGSNFSSGETQLLACARLFLKNNKIVILDESTAKIDKQEEEKLRIAFNELIKNKTAFLIAHRTETLKDADIQLPVKNGKVQH